MQPLRCFSWSWNARYFCALLAHVHFLYFLISKACNIGVGVHLKGVKNGSSWALIANKKVCRIACLTFNISWPTEIAGAIMQMPSIAYSEASSERIRRSCWWILRERERLSTWCVEAIVLCISDLVSHIIVCNVIKIIQISISILDLKNFQK